MTVKEALDIPIQHLTSPQGKINALRIWYNHMYKYAPYLTGTMINDVDISEDGIKFNQIYAHRNYFGTGFNFNKDQHPLATAQWGKAAFDIEGETIKKEIIKTAMKGVK